METDITCMISTFLTCYPMSSQSSHASIDTAKCIFLFTSPVHKMSRPTNLTRTAVQLNLQQSFGGGMDTLVQGSQQILLRYLNAKLIILCTCIANPIYGRLETKLGILPTRSHYPPEDYNTALMLTQNFPSFTKARHSALPLPSYIQSTPRFINIHSFPQLKSCVPFSSTTLHPRCTTPITFSDEPK
jgi:hypothetical protein